MSSVFYSVCIVKHVLLVSTIEQHLNCHTVTAETVVLKWATEWAVEFYKDFLVIQ
jgi:hypothetical protein